MGLWEKGKTKQVEPNSPELQKKVLHAVGLLSKIVGNTLGPGGRPILIERDGLSPLVTKDGVTVAKSVNAYDATQNAIIECVKEVADRTGKQAGDGTTTSVILSEAVVRYGFDWLSRNQNVSPQKFLRDLMSDYANKIKPAIAEMADTVENEQGMKHVALMSANGDDLVAKAVVEAILQAGEDGSVILDESPGKETKTEVQEGFALQKGFDFLGSLGAVFVNNERDMECVHDNPLIVLFNGTLRDANHLGLIVQKNMNSGNARPMIFVAHDFSDEMKQILAVNTKQSPAKLIPVMTPRDGTPMGKDLILQDLAAYTNAQIFDPTNFGKAELQDLGDCDKFRMSRWQTVFIGEPDQERLRERIDNIKAQIETIDKEYDAELYRERIARLTGGITTIYVGGLSELEVREAKARVEDAVCAVRAALKQGVVPGGATTLLRLSQLDIHPVLKQALAEPIARLLDNAGLQGGAIQTVKAVVLEKDGVYDVSTHEMVDPWERGILDPAKVIETAIGNALSVAGTLVTLGGVVVVARDTNLENQAALSKQAFDSMMNGGMPQ
jgi:chaperonin GroEL